ncbi:MAG: PEP-CTERM sorting domain-containing protein [Patescibacteria group bacterium]|nr:PEP-CTERM sorting domain-containing protein [Patescibacteria group bacterium]
MHCRLARFLLLSFLAASVSVASGDWKADIGYTQLLAELGAATPTGANVTASIVEASVNQLSTDYYAVDTTNSQFAGKTITFKSGTWATSGHATNVGSYLFGNTSSLAAGIIEVDNWEANNWIFTGFLNTGSSLEPAVETRDVQNHSWIGNMTTTAGDIDVIRRFDYTIERDNYVAVVGMNNNFSTTVPSLLGHSYNAISVGRSDGSHSAGFTRFDGVGRVAPDIVAPASATSYATPMVGSAAALLLDAAAGNSAYANASNSITVKALLMAGATKDEFPAWDRTPTRPLDEVYGAGELNVYRSYQTLVAGEQDASLTSLVGLTGWDYGTTTGNDLLWFFEVGSGLVLDELSAVLTWNRVITDGITGAGWGDPQSYLANLDLELWSASGFTLDTQLDYSASEVDNVEHIYMQNLAAGRYAFLLPGVGAGTDFALAWYGGATSPIPEPSTVLLLFVGLGAILTLRRRRS